MCKQRQQLSKACTISERCGSHSDSTDSTCENWRLHPALLVSRHGSRPRPEGWQHRLVVLPLPGFFHLALLTAQPALISDHPDWPVHLGGCPSPGAAPHHCTQQGHINALRETRYKAVAAGAATAAPTMAAAAVSSSISWQQQIKIQHWLAAAMNSNFRWRCKT